MRPRVARVLRVGLFVLGVGLLLWLPISFKAWTAVRLPWPLRGLGLASSSGAVTLSIVQQEYQNLQPPRFSFTLLDRQTAIEFTPEALRPTVMQTEYVPTWSSGSTVRVTGIHFPLWLLAFICLVWPVTSFIIARRRNKRGFPVEPKGGGEMVSTPVSSD